VTIETEDQAKDQTKDFGGTLLRYELLRDRRRSFQAVAARTSDTAKAPCRAKDDGRCFAACRWRLQTAISCFGQNGGELYG
jgi:hypothetical protein